YPVSSVAKSSEFYIGLFHPPMLRNAALRAQPDSPPSEAFFFKMGDAYLVMSQAFPPDTPGLDHYSIGLRDYEQARMAAKLQDNGIAGQSRSADIWVHDVDGSMIQLR